MDAKALIDAIGQATGLPLSSEDGTAAMRFGDGRVLNLEAAEGGDALHLYVVLGPMPSAPGPRAAMAEAMLAANLFGAGSGGGAFALDPVHGETLLCRTLRGAALTLAAAEDAAGAIMEAAAALDAGSAPDQAEDAPTGAEGVIIRA